MSWAALVVSVGFLVASSIAFARALARPGADRFWGAIAAAAMQIGLIAMATSALHRFEGDAFLMLQVPVALIAAVLWRRIGQRPVGVGFRPGPVVNGDWVCGALLLGVVAFLMLSGMRQGVTPIWGPDEGMYHAPRIAYWLQHRSIFWYDTPNDRQEVFPFGSELVAAYPLLFVKAEVLARMAFWIAFPGAAAGVWLVARAIGAGPRAALSGALLFVSTPTMLRHAESLKSDAWLPLFILGAVYGVMRPRAADERPGTRFVLAGVLLALAVNVKTTALALTPGLVVPALLEWQPRRIVRSCCGLGVGFVASAAASGLALLLASNLAHAHNLLGAPDLRAIVQPDYSGQQVWAHTVRTPLYLLEFPDQPAEALRQWFERRMQRFAESCGAAALLPKESPTGFPGSFEFRAPAVADRYSTGGLLWLPCLVVGCIGGLVQIGRTWPRPRVRPGAMLALVQLPLFLGVVYLIRWMGGGPDRFWLGAYALSVPLTAKLVGDLVEGRAWLGAVAAMVLIWTAYPSVRGEAVMADRAIAHPMTLDQYDYPFQEVVPKIPAGSRILLFVSGGAREYWFFNPEGGFTNKVYSWGRRAFDAGRADALVSDNQVTHVVIQHDQAFGVGWKDAVTARPVVLWMQQRKDFREVPLRTPHTRLFERIAPPVPTPIPTR